MIPDGTSTPTRSSRFAALVRLERVVLVAGIVFAVVVVAATLLHLAQLRRGAESEVDTRLRTVSRVLSKEIDRSLQSIQSQLEPLDDALRSALAFPNGAATTEPMLQAVARQNPLIREVLVVDAQQRVVASSSGRSVGLDVSRYDFASLPADKLLRPGLPSAGRSVAGAPDVPQGPANARTGFISFTRTIDGAGPALRMVVVVGCDSLINDLKMTSGEEPEQVTVFRYDGQLLATSDAAQLMRETPHPIFSRFIPEREHGGFVDGQAGTEAWLARFDTSAAYPLVVETRLPESVVAERWRDELVVPLAMMAAIVVAIALYTRVTGRALARRAATEARIATQERRLRNILDTAADGIITIDSRGLISEYNRAAENIFGVPPHEAIGRSLSELLPGPLSGRHQGYVERYMLTGHQSVIGRGRTLQTVRRDGRPLEIYLAVSEVVDQGERLFTGIVRDITDVKQAEERFRTLFQRSGEPHLLFDESGLIDCNDAAMTMLGATERDQVLGRRLADLAPAVQPVSQLPSATVVDDAMVAARRDGVRRLEWTAVTLAGTPFPVEMTMTPLQLAEQAAMLVAWHDIAERQRYENELRSARDAAEAAARTKASFLAMMSHELRTPMTGIIGMGDLLSDTELTDEQEHLVKVLRNSAKSLLTVLNDVLDFSKIEAGKLTLESLDFEPAGLASEVIDLLSAAASARGNVLAPDWRTGDMPAVRGDPTRLRQILFNLVGNAIKFTERGRVTVALRSRPLDGDRVRLRVEVRDSGVGIPADVLPTLFRPFQQADTSTSRKFGGTGLGLAICRHLVRAMGGQIGVDSEIGRGSCFWFELDLPRAEAPVAIRPGPTQAARLAGRGGAAAPAGSGLSLLLAEDNPTNQLLITTRLRRAGHQVDVVDNGLRAVDAVQRKDYDLVLMDMQMPELDGSDATRRIRALGGRFERLPIVALTADALPEFRERYLSAGLTDYLTKPIDWPALHEALARHAPQPSRVALDGMAADRASGTGVERLPKTVDRPAADAADGRASEQPPIDEAEVARMRGEFGEDIYGMALEIYWPKAEQDLQACATAIAAGGIGRWSDPAHGLKGSSASMGFATVAAAAAVLERATDPQSASAALQAMRKAFARTRADHDTVAAQPTDAA